MFLSNLWISISPLTQGKILLFQYMAFLIFHSPNVRVIVFELSGTTFYGVYSRIGDQIVIHWKNYILLDIIYCFLNHSSVIMVISLSADVIVPYRYWYIKLLILVCVKLKVFLFF